VFSCLLPCCCYADPDDWLLCVVTTPAPPPSLVAGHINLIQNWFEELKAKVPAGGAK
jgi:predicted ATP-grasp superfamily ATP-dependent carboligase